MTDRITGDPIECRKGDALSFTIVYDDGLPARYSKLVFQASLLFGSGDLVLLEADETSGITRTDATPPTTVSIFIGATQTDLMPDETAPMRVAAGLRRSDPANPDDAYSTIVPMEIMPEVVSG